MYIYICIYKCIDLDAPFISRAHWHGLARFAEFSQHQRFLSLDVLVRIRRLGGWDVHRASLLIGALACIARWTSELCYSGWVSGAGTLSFVRISKCCCECRCVGLDECLEHVISCALKKCWKIQGLNSTNQQTSLEVLKFWSRSAVQQDHCETAAQKSIA